MSLLRTFMSAQLMTSYPAPTTGRKSQFSLTDTRTPPMGTYFGTKMDHAGYLFPLTPLYICKSLSTNPPSHLGEILIPPHVTQLDEGHLAV